MRIISKFSDYYDVGMAQGQDQDLVFLREYREHVLQGKTPSTEVEKVGLRLLKLLPATRDVTGLKGDIARVRLIPGVIAFTGRLYPYVCAVPSLRLRAGATPPVTSSPCLPVVGPSLPPKFFYDELALVTYFKLMGHDLPLPARSRWSFDVERQGWNTFFDIKQDTRLLNDCVNQKLAVVEVHKNLDEPVMTINPVLKSLEFYRCFDAWEAFQELSMFIGNLAQPDPCTVTLSEKAKLAKHGMDEWSFKKMPSQKR